MRNKSGYTWKEYEDRKKEAKIHGAKLPSIQDCVMSACVYNEVCSRSGFVDSVTVLTGIDKREVERNISAVLRKLVNEGKLIQVGHNRWHSTSTRL